jgi:hypothetical protein
MQGIRARAFSLSFFIVLYSLPAALAQQKDAAAIVSLTETLQVAGWNSSQLPSHAIVEGEFVRVMEGVEHTFPATFKIKGPHRFKMTSDSGLTSIVNDKKAIIKTATESRKVPGHSAYAMRPMALPFFSEIPNLSADQFEIVQKNAETVMGRMCDVISIEPNISPKDDPGGLRRRAGKLKLWIAQATRLLAQVEFVRPMDTNPAAMLEYTVRFSDYRRVGEIMVPFEHEELIRGRSLYKFKVKSVEFDVDIPDEEFEIAEEKEVN